MNIFDQLFTKHTGEINMIVLAGTFFYRYRILLYVAVLLTGVSSCTIIKNPPSKPFVYETKVKVISDEINIDERKDLESQLDNQYHDSIRVRIVQKILGYEPGIGPRMFYSVMENPAVYDSINADKSITFMKGLLHNLGYYRDSIYYQTTIKKIKDQERVSVLFNVIPGKQFKLDSIAYNFNKDTLSFLSQSTKDTLQKITDGSMDRSFIKKQGPYAIPLISSELDRLSDLYRNNGYLLFSREELLVLWDTVGLALLQPTLDPLEQLAILQRKRDFPTADIEIRLRTNPDTSHARRFHVGSVTIYPDITADTNLLKRKIEQYRDLTVISYQDMFKSKILGENVYLRRGDMYSQRNYLRTLNRFNSIGSWRLVTIDQVPRENTDTVDFVVKLTPAAKYFFDQSIEGSQNWGNPLTEGTLIGVNFSLLNRNFAKRAYQSTTNLRFGTEVGSSSIASTKQALISHTIFFPRAIPRLDFLGPLNFLRNKDNVRSSFGLSGSFIDRADFLRLSTVNTSWGYEFSKNNKLFNVRFPNIEYTFLDTGRILKELIAANQSYKYLFNGGLVSSIMGGVTMPLGGNSRVAHSLRANAEVSGTFGWLREFKFGDELYRFFKGELEYTFKKSYGRNMIATRALTGAGYGWPFDPKDTQNRHLPFFKGFFAGGASSMRSWGVRKLGPGSVSKSFARDSFPDRFGDLQFEVNGEYRMYVTTLKGVPINVVLPFVDIGNIWYLRDHQSYEGTREKFKIDSFFHDLAIGIGTGVRIDFGLFLIRLDYGYKAKDPSPADPALRNKLFPDFKPFGGVLQIGVTYPF